MRDCEEMRIIWVMIPFGGGDDMMMNRDAVLSVRCQLSEMNRFNFVNKQLIAR